MVSLWLSTQCSSFAAFALRVALPKRPGLAIHWELAPHSRWRSGIALRVGRGPFRSMAAAGFGVLAAASGRVSRFKDFVRSVLSIAKRNHALRLKRPRLDYRRSWPLGIRIGSCTTTVRL